MKKQLSQVAEFHETFGLPVLESPQIPDRARVELRLNLLEEELAELREAMERGNVEDALKEWCDLLYVAYGAGLEFGFSSIAVAAFSEVHRSNMSKVIPERGEAVLQAPRVSDRLERGKGWGVEVWPVKSGFILRRTPDLKVLKPLTYSPANVAKLIP